MGIVTISSSDCHTDITEPICFALSNIKHTGQHCVGLATYNGKDFYKYTQTWKFGDFSHDGRPGGYAGVGSTSHIPDDQPVVAQSPRLGRFALAFDGYMINSAGLRKELGGTFYTQDDAEVAARVMCEGSTVEEGLGMLAGRVKGPYNVAVISEEGPVYVARSPLGMRSLVLASGNGMTGATSSSRGLTKAGMSLTREFAPGEILRMTGERADTMGRIGRGGQRLCSFLFGYWEYEDVDIEGIPVAVPKQRIGKWHGLRDKEDGYDSKIDIVIPIPGSGIPYGESYAAELGRPLIFGLLKYPYAIRSYPEKRGHKEQVARGKLTVIRSKVEGLRVALVDDSTRMGTQILEGPIKMLQENGVSEIHVRFGSPRNTHCCRALYEQGYTDADLIANKFPDDMAMAEHFGVQSVRFIPLEPYIKAITDGHRLRPEDLCMGCHTGDFSFLDL